MGGGGFTVTYSAGGAGSGGVYAPSAIHGSAGQSYTLTTEKVYEYDRFMRFLKLNPDVAERYAVHKTYEILKDEHIQK